jgi:hypothetical protein
MQDFQQKTAGQMSSDYRRGEESTGLDPRHDLMDYLATYARERPEVAALWCFGIGFILGWKLKPW